MCIRDSVYRARLGIAMQELTIVIECSDMDHRNEVIRNMKAAGYSIYE